MDKPWLHICFDLFIKPGFFKANQLYIVLCGILFYRILYEDPVQDPGYDWLVLAAHQAGMSAYNSLQGLGIGHVHEASKIAAPFNMWYGVLYNTMIIDIATTLVLS